MKSVTQFAKEKALSRQRVLVLIEQERIKAEKVGNQWVILDNKIQPPKYKGRPPIIH